MCLFGILEPCLEVAICQELLEKVSFYIGIISLKTLKDTPTSKAEHVRGECNEAAPQEREQS